MKNNAPIAEAQRQGLDHQLEQVTGELTRTGGKGLTALVMLFNWPIWLFLWWFTGWLTQDAYGSFAGIWRPFFPIPAPALVAVLRLVVPAALTVLTVVLAVRDRRQGSGWLRHVNGGLKFLIGFFSTPFLIAYSIAYAVTPTATPIAKLKSADGGFEYLTHLQTRIEKAHNHRPGAVLGTLNGAIKVALPRGGVLVIGPPGSGKTSAHIIPTVLTAPSKHGSDATATRGALLRSSWPS